MKLKNKILTEIPVKQLWNDNEIIYASRERYLTVEDIKDMLMNYPVEFVVANVGSKLKWIPYTKCYEFWKSEVKSHIVNNPEDKKKGFDIDNFSGNYAYIASEWSGEIETPIILLEKYH